MVQDDDGLYMKWSDPQMALATEGPDYSSARLEKLRPNMTQHRDLPG